MSALVHLREALEIYVSLADRGMIVRSFKELTAALFFAARFQEAAEVAGRGLAYVEAEVSADRAHLLAALGETRAATADYEAAQEALQEALNIASELSDPKLLARVLGARSAANLLFFRLREALAEGLRSEQLGGSEAPPWQRALQLAALHHTVLYLGRLEDAARIADKLEPLARKIGQSFSVALCLTRRAWVEFAKAPDLAKLETGLLQVPKPDQEAQFFLWEPYSEVQLSLVDFLRGNWAGALLHAQAACLPGIGTSIEGFGVGTLFRQLAYAGDRAGALAILDEKRALLPRSARPNRMGSWLMLAPAIEGLVILREQSHAAQLYPLARELIDTGAVTLWLNLRFTQTIAGIAAAAASQWEAAEDHFHIAMQQAKSFPNLLEQAEIRRFRAMMLIDRAAPGDRKKAQGLLSEALETYVHIGMPRHVEVTQTLLARAAALSA